MLDTWSRGGGSKRHGTLFKVTQGPVKSLHFSEGDEDFKGHLLLTIWQHSSSLGMSHKEAIGEIKAPKPTVAGIIMHVNHREL